MRRLRSKATARSVASVGEQLVGALEVVIVNGPKAATFASVASDDEHADAVRAVGQGRGVEGQRAARGGLARHDRRVRARADVLLGGRAAVDLDLGAQDAAAASVAENETPRTPDSTPPAVSEPREAT